jgi:site-specific DNA recombinase
LLPKIVTVVRPAGKREPARIQCTITRGELEARVLDGLKDRLLAPDLVKEFVQEFNAEIEGERVSAKARISANERNLAGIDRKIGSMIKAIEDGMYHPTMKDRMAQLEADRATIIAGAASIEAPKVDVLVHPNLPELYRRKVTEFSKPARSATRQKI